MKNCEPLVLGPALAMLKTPGPVCLRLKFSSSNFYYKIVLNSLYDQVLIFYLLSF